MVGATIFGCQGPRLLAEETRFFGDANPFGFILFARNLEAPEQIRSLCNDLRSAVGRNVPIFIDQEGGRVARLRAPNWLEWLPALEQVERCSDENAARGMYIRSRLIAAELRAIGIDGNCVPIVDVPGGDVHEIIRNRCYGTSPGAVAKIGRSVAQGCLDGGVLPVLKHIPGHGRPDVDSHLGLPRTAVSLAELSSVDFIPFKALQDLPLGMTAHVVYEAIDPDMPATFSAPVIDIVRKDIGYGGLLMTDDISMGALSGSFTERSQRALAAGCDIILHCHADPAEMAEIAEVACALEGVGLRRAEAAIGQRKSPDEIDEKRLLAELDSMIKLPGNERTNAL